MPFQSAAVSAKPAADHRTAIASIVGFWLFYCLITTLRALVMDFDDQWGMLGRRAVVTLVGAGLTVCLYLALRPFDGRPLRQRVAAAAVLTLPIAALFATFNYAAFYVYNPVENVRSMMRDTDQADPKQQEALLRRMAARPIATIADGTVTWYFFFAAWAAFHVALGYAAEVRRAERRAAGFQAAARDAELRALRYQVNPHFLFNTLNSLSTLVLRNRPDEAERMILNLSTFFRTSLTASPAEDLTLVEEVRLQRLYLDIEAVRFPERLRVAVEVPRALEDACIPGLLLQPLVENAIKHGVSRAARPVTLTIRAEALDSARLRLSVLDDGPSGEADAVEPLGRHHPVGTGTGLRNVRERLAARFGADGEIRWGPRPTEGFEVIVLLPLIRHGC